MPVVKKRNQQTESRLLLESEEPVELPPAEIDDRAVLVQFEQFKPYIPELLAALRAGTVAEPVPVMIDGSTFAIHGPTRGGRSRGSGHECGGLTPLLTCGRHASGTILHCTEAVQRTEAYVVCQSGAARR